MKKILVCFCLLLVGLATSANAQFNSSESARKAGEKLARGDRVGAIAVLDKAIEDRKDLQETYKMRSNLRAGGGDFDGAIADLGEAIKLTPDDADLYQERAMYRMFKHDSAGALQDYDAAIAHGVKGEKIYVGRAGVKRDSGDVQGAITDYRNALAINPMYAPAHTGLASTLERKGELDAAIVHLQDFLDLYEGKRGGKLPTAQDANWSAINKSVKPDGPEKEGDQGYSADGTVSLRFNGKSPEEINRELSKYEQRVDVAEAYASLGKLYVKKNDIDKALENLDKGLKMDKNLPFGRKLRGEARIKKGDLPGAIDDLKAAVNSHSGAPDVHYTRGLLLVLQGQDAEAEQEFALHRQRFPTGQPDSSILIEEAKKLRAQQNQQ